MHVEQMCASVLDVTLTAYRALQRRLFADNPAVHTCLVNAFRAAAAKTSASLARALDVLWLQHCPSDVFSGFLAGAAAITRRPETCQTDVSSPLTMWVCV